MCQINLMHRVVKYRAEFHAYQENLPCTIPPCASNLSDTPNLIAYNMQIRKCHLIFITVYSEPYYSIIQQGTLAVAVALPVHSYHKPQHKGSESLSGC